MNRPIRFRAWDLTYKEMMIDVQNRQSFTEYHYSETGTYLGFTDMIDNPKFILIQYTGLKDCTWKEIYEGDILGEIYLDGWTYKSAPVIFDAGAFFLELEAGKYCPCLYEIPQEHRKVIGNIHENKG